MKDRGTIEHLAPWLGLVAAGVGWALSHQVGSDSVFDDCRSNGNGFVLVACLIGLLIIAAGGYFSLDVWRDRGESEGRRFVGLLGGLIALLAAFAVVLQALAATILPRCVG